MVRERERLVVVSNRLPFTLRRAGDGWRTERSPGGVATALSPLVQKTGGLWIGWPGEEPSPDPRRGAVLERWRRQYGCVAVELPGDIAGRFYEGYANQTLWPLFHQFPQSLEFDPAGWEAYAQANRIFCDTVLSELRPGDLLWVHDYHLMLLPRLLREAQASVRVGFFLHVPFPASDVFRTLPHREDLLSGLLGADLVAFHTHQDLQHFRASLLRVLGVESHLDRVDIGRDTTRLRALPIGIAPDEFVVLLEKDAETQQALRRHLARFEGQRVLLAVDRLDYTKGIPQRLRSFERLLERAPELRGRIVLVQIAVPSRERIPTYHALRQEVSALVGEINGAFGTPEWTPVVYIRRGVSRSELVALYAAADVAWITPLRDGMNLVAKEYVACQRGGRGALVLSEFAGAAAEMGEAFLVNPYDEEATAAAIERALRLPAAERAERMQALFKRVERNNVFAWGERFVADLRAAAGSRPRLQSAGQRLPTDIVARACAGASRRLVLLDYDGTLVPLRKAPWEATPATEVLELLERLAQEPNNTVVVVSGRPRRNLESWLGDVPRLWLAAEHGVLLRSPSTRAWQSAGAAPAPELKQRVLQVLEHFADRTPGSLIEEKEYSLVWHYAMCEPEFGEWLANELMASLDEMLAETELRPQRSRKSVEVRPSWARKSAVLGLLGRLAADADFQLAIGDDRTDEELFERLPAGAWTVHVGASPSSARFHLADSGEVRELLGQLGPTLGAARLSVA